MTHLNLITCEKVEMLCCLVFQSRNARTEMFRLYFLLSLSERYGGNAGGTFKAITMTDDIEKKLEKARDRAENYGYLYGRHATADDYIKTTYAKLYCDIPSDYKTVPERDAWVRRQDEFINAIERKRDAFAAWRTAETYMKILFAQVDVWRSQEASNLG